MNDEQIDNFKAWVEMQPEPYVPYPQCKRFLSDLLEVSESEAELEMAQISGDDLKVVSGGAGRVVFPLPLDPLEKSDIKSVFDGEHSETRIIRVASAVHRNTGHEVEDIVDFIRDLDDTIVHGDVFNWVPEQSDSNDDYPL